MNQSKGKFRTWKSKKQWLFAGGVVTSGLLLSALVSALFLGSGAGPRQVKDPDNRQVALSGDNGGSQRPGLSGDNGGRLSGEEG
ncbi:UNVERIFIED_CONTAM: KxYKxGKxW signal peptide domain-containing protein [Streptococcus canis]|uniref:KxYKxGKxW signal peptide domain-containing protein n=1 Tax=Streptococcus canis TaxID=1329 RepID=UPI00114245D0|nr:KxYKxGKxW signal peptide domain-containing protein [Streptococcus canis]MDV6022545.1 KxYKxGKxW signal peptide domain-containing protein [Streptococcus canis]